jgi:hypothetical protein
MGRVSKFDSFKNRNRYEEEDDTWEPQENLPQELLDNFEPVTIFLQIICITAK